MKYSLILLAVIGTTFAEIIFEERFGSGMYLLKNSSEFLGSICMFHPISHFIDIW